MQRCSLRSPLYTFFQPLVWQVLSLSDIGWRRTFITFINIAANRGFWLFQKRSQKSTFLIDHYAVTASKNSRRLNETSRWQLHCCLRRPIRNTFFDTILVWRLLSGAFLSLMEYGNFSIAMNCTKNSWSSGLWGADYFDDEISAERELFLRKSERKGHFLSNSGFFRNKMLVYMKIRANLAATFHISRFRRMALVKTKQRNSNQLKLHRMESPNEEHVRLLLWLARGMAHSIAKTWPGIFSKQKKKWNFQRAFNVDKIYWINSASGNNFRFRHLKIHSIRIDLRATPTTIISVEFLAWLKPTWRSKSIILQFAFQFYHKKIPE